MSIAAACALSIGVAWASALLIPLGTPVMFASGRSEFTSQDARRWKGRTFNRVAVQSWSIDADRWIPDSTLQECWAASARAAFAAAAPRWPAPFQTASVERATRELPLWAGVVQDARGWPFRALRCEWHFDAAGASASEGRSIPRSTGVTGGIELAAVPVTMSPYFIVRALPLAPIWPGLIGDTAVFTPVLWVLTGGIGSTRRLLRLRGNHCPSCGYSLAGQISPGCPECGWERARPA